YLTEVAADGRERYVTEGVLRALHRKDAPDTPAHRTKWPTHSFLRDDAAPLVPGETTLLRIALLPTSWRLRKGSRLRLAIAGADADHYAQVPHGRPPMLTLHHGGDAPSRLAPPPRGHKTEGGQSEQSERAHAFFAARCAWARRCAPLPTLQLRFARDDARARPCYESRSRLSSVGRAPDL